MREVGLDAAALAAALVRRPSVSPRDEGALDIVAAELEKLDFTCHRLVFGGDGSEPVDNLYARLGESAPNLCFAGHTDVVPPGEAANWSHPPFAAEIRNGTLYGRGAVDMKGAIACALAAAIDHPAPRAGKGSISFLITGDEEGIAVNGTVKLLQWAAERGERFDHCILGEPSNVAAVGDTIKVGRRGSLNGTLVVTGKQGHVAYPERADNPVRGLVTLMSALMAAPLDQGSANFGASNLEFTSIDIGNPVVNLIPAEARARFNIRFNDCHSQISLRTLIEKRAAEAAGARVRWHIAWEPSNADSFLTKQGLFLELFVGAIKEVTGETPKLSTSGGTSDARFIASYCPVIEFGLVGQTMHQIDERTPVSDLEKLTKIYRGLLDRYFA
jgi:succinyl-diaminopimelate desuccinylase